MRRVWVTLAVLSCVADAQAAGQVFDCSTADAQFNIRRGYNSHYPAILIQDRVVNTDGSEENTVRVHLLGLSDPTAAPSPLVPAVEAPPSEQAVAGLAIGEAYILGEQVRLVVSKEDLPEQRACQKDEEPFEGVAGSSQSDVRDITFAVKGAKFDEGYPLYGNSDGSLTLKFYCEFSYATDVPSCLAD